jgi:antirestriction protein ArdC
MVRCSRHARENNMHGTVPSEAKSDVFRSITSKIVSAIESGAPQFVMPWHGGILPPTFPMNAATDKAYRGVNVIALWVDAMSKRYISGYWASYKQWQTLGAQVRKGEHGSIIVFYKPLDQPELGVQNTAPGEEQKDGFRFVARASHVFNVEQVDGWTPPIPEAKSIVQINEEVAAFIDAVGADVRHGFHGARYRRDLDCIEMPSPEMFIGTATSSPVESYHAVLCHECVHWSGAGHRLNREFGKRFGDRAYAFEELIAELGAAFLCSVFRITNEPRPDHAAYVSTWIDVLNRDTKAVFTAASKAQEAVQFLTELAAAKARS